MITKIFLEISYFKFNDDFVKQTFVYVQIHTELMVKSKGKNIYTTKPLLSKTEKFLYT